MIAWAFWALFPFSRLVHAWSIPLQYLGRPYILYRKRYGLAMRRQAARGGAGDGAFTVCFYAWALLGPLGPDLQEQLDLSDTQIALTISSSRSCSAR